MTDAGDALYLTEADVVSLVDLPDAIDALEDACARQGRGEALEIPKALGTYGDGSSLHSLGSAFPDAAIGGFKNWVNTKRGAVALMTVFDVERGRLLAIVEAGALGQLRTAAIAGVAARWLAAPDASDMALIGTGRQSMLQVAAVAAVRPLQRLRVFSPNPEKRRAFVERVRASFAFSVEERADAAQALDGASLVTLVTRAQEPFVHARMLAAGAHVNAVGAILPANAEFAQDVFDRTRAVVVDSLAGVQRNSREFIDRFGPAGSGAWDAVQTLSDVIAGRPHPAAPSSGDGGDITLFKAMGMGISDLAVVRLVIERARAARNVGVPIAPHRPAIPRWRRSSDARAAAAAE